MADFFKPRRGTQLKATEVLKGENKLRAGELFFELEYEGNTKTVKSGRIMIGDGTSNYADLVTNDRYIFNPDDYMGANSKFTPTPSTETTIDANIAKIGSENNIKEKMGATSKALSIIGDNKVDKKDIIYATKFEEIPGSRGQGTRITFSNGDTSSYTTHEFDEFGFEYKLGDSKNAATSMYSFKSRNANTATYATKSGTANKAGANDDGISLTNFVKNISTVSSIDHQNELEIDTSSGTKYITPKYADEAGRADEANYAALPTLKYNSRSISEALLTFTIDTSATSTGDREYKNFVTSYAFHTNRTLDLNTLKESLIFLDVVCKKSGDTGYKFKRYCKFKTDEVFQTDQDFSDISMSFSIGNSSDTGSPALIMNTSISYTKVVICGYIILQNPNI